MTGNHFSKHKMCIHLHLAFLFLVLESLIMKLKLPQEFGCDCSCWFRIYSFHFTRYMQSIKVHQVSKYWLLLTLQKLHRLLCFSCTGICMQNMQSTVFTLNFLVGNSMSTCNIHIQKHSSKKQSSFFFPLLFTTGGTVEILFTI